MRLWAVLILCFFLTECIFKTSQTSKFYTLINEPSPSISNSYKSLVGIIRVQLPKHIDRPQIITQKQNTSEMIISEYNRWVENPSILITGVLVENLSTILPSAQIKMNQYGLEQFDRIISVEVVKLNAILDNKAELIAWYTIKNKSEQILSRNKFADSIQIGKSYNDLTNGYNKLLNKLSQDIAYTLIKQ